MRRMLAEPNPVGGECEVRNVTLFRSRTAPSGSQYEVLLRTPLTAD
jgi:2'-5' RNA ligase